MLIPFKEKNPTVHDTVFLAPGSYLIGDVQVGKETLLRSMPFYVVMRTKRSR